MTIRGSARVFDSPDAIGEYLAERLLRRIEQARLAGARFLLGCPTGRTPRPLYNAMARRLGETGQDISHLILIMMDEYLVKGSSEFEYASADMPWSCHHFARAEILDRWNRHLPRAHRLRNDSLWFPDPREPDAYDGMIAKAGGIDFFILASGASDGHVGFNPPGSARQSRTRIIELAEETRRDNLGTLPAFGTLDKVPTHGISVGIDTIAWAKDAAMIVWGSGKARSLGRILEARRYDPKWPATVIYECASGEILSDRQAADGAASLRKTPDA